MLEILLLVAVMGTTIVASISVVASIMFAMQVDKKILNMGMDPDGLRNRQKKES